MIRLFGCASLALFGALILAVLFSLPVVPLQAQTPAAELSALSLSSGTLRPLFAATTTEYRAAVQYHVSQFTVTATAATGVTVDYLDSADLTLADADTNTAGHQVDLAVGETVFKVKVTRDSNTETYTVTVERDSAQVFGWTPTRDINALEAAGNASPQGIWSDDTTMWVVDDEDDKVYAYALSGGARDESKEFSLHTDNGDPQGIWSDDTTIWVADDDDDKLYAYTLSGGARDTSKEFGLHSDNGDPAGIWSDGTTIWVANNKSMSVSPFKVFAYTLSGGANDTDKEFAPNWNPVGLWSQGSTMWVVNHVDVNVGTRVDAYTIDLNTDRTAGPNHGRWESDKQFAIRSEFGTSPVGIWSDGEGAVWITAPDTPKVESHHMLPFSAGGTTLSALTINDGTSDATLRPAFAVTTLAYSTAVTDTVNLVTISATPGEVTSTVDYLDADDEALEDADPDMAGFQVNAAVGQTLIQLLVTAQNGTALLHSVVVERDSSLPGGWTPTQDVVGLDPVALNWPRGIWSDGTTIWVTNDNFNTSGIYAYTLATSTRDTTKEFSLDAANASPGGIWSNGTTIWVVDRDVSQAKLYAYTLSGGARDATKDIDLHADNLRPMGIFSDGTTVWITDTDATNGGLYAYTLEGGGRDTSKEFDLTANSSNSAIGDIWSDGTIVWVGDTQARKLFAYAKDTGAPDAARDISLSQTYPHGVWGQGSTLWVAEPGPDISGAPARYHRIFAYRKPPSSPSDVTLSNLDVSPSPLVPSFTANLRPAFSYPRATYRAAVPNKASQVTVGATRNNDTTMVTYLDANGDALVDADPNTTGQQVTVEVGETSIAIRLAAGGTALTYTVIVERDSAELYGWTPTKDLNNLLLDNPRLAGDNIRSVWADSTTLYVLPHTEPQVYAYTRATGARNEDKDIATNPSTIQENETFKAGIWSDGTTMWVLNYGAGEDAMGTHTFDGTGKIYAYTLSDGGRDTGKDFPLHLDPTWSARGIWSDGTTVWVSDWNAAKLFAYTLADGTRAPDSDITLHLLNESAMGIWSDGTTIWVAQWNSQKFYAYTLATGAYDPDKDFDRVPDNRYPRDIWSDGTTLFVTDHYGGKLFTYNMTGLEMDAALSALTLSGITLSPQFNSGTYTYSGNTPATLAETNVMATTRAPDATVVYKLNGVPDDDGTLALGGGVNTITVDVTAEDGMTTKTYTITVINPTTLSFGSDTYDVVEGDAVELTVELSNALSSEVPIRLLQQRIGSSNEDYDGVPEIVTIGANETSVSFTVTANQDTQAEGTESVELILYVGQSLGVTYGDHQVTIVNIIDDDTPSMTIMPRMLDVDEGGTATYTVKLNTVPTDDVTVAITSSDPGAATVVPATLTFTPLDWNAAKTVTVTGVEDGDRNDESVALSNDPSDGGYDGVGTEEVALSVADNDVPGVRVSRTALTVTEEDTNGNTYTVVLSIQPTASVTVTVGGFSGTDVTANPASLTFTTQNWNTPRTVTVTAAGDADLTDDTVTLTHGAASTDTDYDGIAVAGVTVTVTDNDDGAPPPPPITGGGGGGFGPALDAPKFVDGFRTSRPLDENAGVGDAVGDPVTATHPRDFAVIYSLSGTDASLFTVDEDTGQIRLGQAITLALGQTYTVNLTATDSGGHGRHHHRGHCGGGGPHTTATT